MRWFRNLPNLFTCLRICLVYPIVLAILARDFPRALIFVAVAGFTDGLDGYLARRFQWTSRAGAYLDPVADKLLLGAVYLSLGYVAAIPWWLVGLIFGRDALLLIAAGAALGFTKLRNFPPSIWGKLSTVVQIGAALIVMVSHAGGSFAMAWVEPAVWIAAAATAWSGLHYAWRGVRMLRE